MKEWDDYLYSQTTDIKMFKRIKILNAKVAIHRYKLQNLYAAP